MRTISLCIIIPLWLFSSHALCSTKQPLWLYEDGGQSKVGIVLCHGKGGDPEFWVVEPLRLGLNNDLGAHTISLQMPGGKKELAEYGEDFPEASRRIQAAIDFLQQQKGVTQLFIVAHSLGSRMATSYLASSPTPAINGFVGVGMLNNGGKPFDCRQNLTGLSIPILDIYGELGQAGDAALPGREKNLLSASYQQIAIGNADHAFSEHEDELLQAVSRWLKITFTKTKDH